MLRNVASSSRYSAVDTWAAQHGNSTTHDTFSDSQLSTTELYSISYSLLYNPSYSPLNCLILAEMHTSQFHVRLVCSLRYCLRKVYHATRRTACFLPCCTTCCVQPHLCVAVPCMAMCGLLYCLHTAYCAAQCITYCTACYVQPHLGVTSHQPVPSNLNAKHRQQGTKEEVWEVLDNCSTHTQYNAGAAQHGTGSCLRVLCFPGCTVHAAAAGL